MSRVREELGRFATRYGFTFKGWLIAMVIFPPGAVLIPFKIPGLRMALRIAMSGFALTLHAALTLGGSVFIIAMLTRGWEALAERF